MVVLHSQSTVRSGWRTSKLSLRASFMSGQWPAKSPPKLLTCSSKMGSVPWMPWNSLTRTIWCSPERHSDNRRAATMTALASGHCTTMPELWQDPQVHLISSATGRSGNAHYDVVDFIGKDSIEEEVVAGTHEGRHIIVKSGEKLKLEAITLSQWLIANLAITYRLLGEGKLGDDGVIDYLSYTTKIYQLTQRYENVSVYFYDQEYRKRLASHSFRWGTDIPHLHTMQLTPCDPHSNASPTHPTPPPNPPTQPPPLKQIRAA